LFFGDGHGTCTTLRPTRGGRQRLRTAGPPTVTPPAAVKYAQTARLAKRARMTDAARSDAMVAAWLASRTLAPSLTASSAVERFAALRARVLAKQVKAGEMQTREGAVRERPPEEGTVSPRETKIEQERTPGERAVTPRGVQKTADRKKNCAVAPPDVGRPMAYEGRKRPPEEGAVSPRETKKTRWSGRGMSAQLRLRYMRNWRYSFNAVLGAALVVAPAWWW
jgi:hypothetical protein